jgi:sugar transferase (PEP-CTERM/EpsH1 system associated)
VHVLYSFGTGGLEKGIATLARNASSDLEHVILCLASSGLAARWLPAGTRVIELRKPAGNSVRSLWRLARELKRLEPSVVHTRNWSGMDGILAARLAGIRPVVQGEHGWGIEDPVGLHPRRLRVRRLLSRWVQEYTCVSGAIEHWLQQDVRVRCPVTRIYNGVDPEVCRPGPGAEIRAGLNLPAEAFVVGTVGRLDPIKDHPTLFQAFERLCEHRPNAFLLVVGEGPERARLQALAGERIRLLGDRCDVPELMRALDVFVLPSRNEGISNTLLEAMATGLPVIATRVGGNPELVEDGWTGTLVPPHDAAALASAMQRYLLDSEHARACGQRARCAVQARFDVASMVRGYEAVYRRVAGRDVVLPPRKVDRLKAGDVNPEY